MFSMFLFYPSTDPGTVVYIIFPILFVQILLERYAYSEIVGTFILI